MIETPVETEVTPADTLRHAALFIEEHGWTQRAFREPDGSVCILGAVFAVNNDLDNPWTPRWGGRSKAAAELLQRHLGFLGISDVAWWNDNPARTRDEVLAALRAASHSGER